MVMVLVGLYFCIALAAVLIAWVAYFLFCKEKTKKIQYPDYYSQNREVALHYQHESAPAHVATAAKLTGAGILLLPGRSRKHDTEVNRDISFTNLPTHEGNDVVDIIKDTLEGVDADVNNEKDIKTDSAGITAAHKEISAVTTHAGDSRHHFEPSHGDSASDWAHGSGSHGYGGAGSDFSHGGYDGNDNSGGGYDN